MSQAYNATQHLHFYGRKSVVVLNFLQLYWSKFIIFFNCLCHCKFKVFFYFLS